MRQATGNWYIMWVKEPVKIETSTLNQKDDNPGKQPEDELLLPSEV